MNTMNFGVPESLQEFVLARVNEGGYSNASEYVAELIRADQIKEERARLESELLKGINSPKAPMTEQDWSDIKTEVQQRHESRLARPQNSPQ